MRAAITQLEFHDLARRRLRQIAEDDRARHLEASHALRQWSISASAETAGASGFNATKAQGVSPHLSSGRATTAASSTASWL